MSGQSMAEVLAGHLYDLRTHSCACMEKRRNPPHLGFKKHAAHQAAALSAAGIGPVQEAKADAWDEGAEEISQRIDQIEGHQVPESEYPALLASREEAVNAYRYMRARAAALRGQ